MTHPPPKPPSPPLQNLNNALAETLLVGGCDPAILNDQVEILDRLFAAIVNEQIAPKLDNKGNYNQTAQEWLKLALQCQKQCAETLKSRAAIDYMQNLGAIHTPPPYKTIKRTEGS